jgi:hypothetical protein
VTDHPRHAYDPLEDFHLANDRQANELAWRGRGGATEEEREAIRRVIWELYGMEFEETERGAA